MRSWTLALLLASPRRALPPRRRRWASPGAWWPSRPRRARSPPARWPSTWSSCRPTAGRRSAPAISAAAEAGERSVLLTFDDPASALRYVVPLLDLYRMPAVVTVGPAQAADPALAPVLEGLAASPWVELLPRGWRRSRAAAGAPAVRCEAGRRSRRRPAGRTEKLVAPEPEPGGPGGPAARDHAARRRPVWPGRLAPGAAGGERWRPASG